MKKLESLTNLPWYKLAIQAIAVFAAIYVFSPIVLNVFKSSTSDLQANRTLVTDEPGVIDIANMPSTLRMTKGLSVLEDQNANLTIEDFLITEQKAMFKSVVGDQNHGFSKSVFWAKFDVINTGSKSKFVVLRQDYPLIDHLSFWQTKGAEIIKHVETGDKTSFDSREIIHKDFLFNIELEPGEKNSIYLRYQSSGSLNIGLSLNTNNYLLSQFADEQLAFGAYYGGVLVLAFYNTFLFFAAREKAFTHYIWYLVSYGLYMSTHNGYAFQFLWPDNPWLANHSLLLLLSLTLYWGMRFSQEIVSSQIYAPKLDKIGLGLQYLSVMLFIGSFVLPYDFVVLSLSVVTVAVCIVIIGIGIISLLAKYKPAIFFMIAWSTLLIAVLIYMLKSFGILPHNAFTQNAFQIASLIEMTLLSVALAHHFSELKKKSYTDALTYLFNRRHFDDQFAIEFNQAREQKSDLSLLVLDIDHFKNFNDTYGHAEGDKVIQFVAKVLKNNVRKPLIPCRYGGEEFVVILPRTAKSSAIVLAERLRQTIELDSKKEKPITISVGVACINDQTKTDTIIDSPQALFEAADAALYQAKEGGRNRVVEFSLDNQLTQ